MSSWLCLVFPWCPHLTSVTSRHLHKYLDTNPQILCGKAGSFLPKMALFIKILEREGGTVHQKWKLEGKVSCRKWEMAPGTPHPAWASQRSTDGKTCCWGWSKICPPWVLGPACWAEWNTKRGSLSAALHLSQAIDRRSSQRDRQTVTGKMNCHLPFFRGSVG